MISFKYSSIRTLLQRKKQNHAEWLSQIAFQDFRIGIIWRLSLFSTWSFNIFNYSIKKSSETFLALIVLHHKTLIYSFPLFVFFFDSLSKVRPLDFQSGNLVWLEFKSVALNCYRLVWSRFGLYQRIMIWSFNCCWWRLPLSVLPFVMEHMS